MKFLDLYTDSACTQLYKSCPCYPIDYQSFVGTPTSITNPRTQKSHMAIGNIGGAWMSFNNVTPITGGTPAFSTADGYMDTPTTFYCKNGLHFTIAMQSREYGDLSISNIGIDDVRYSQGYSTTHRPNTVGYMYICAAEVNGTVYYGLTGFVTTGGYDNTWLPVLMSGSGFWADAFRKPFNYGAESVEDSGMGTGEIAHTGVGKSPEPTINFPTGTQGFHAYRINETALDELQGSLWGEGSTLAKSLWQKFLNSRHNPIHCIVACYRLPELFMPTGGASSGIHLGGINIPITRGTCQTVTLGIRDKWTVSMPIVNAPFDSWLDYYGVSIKISVPFCGEIVTSPEMIFGRPVHVTYRVDQANGNLSALVFSGYINSDHYILGELTGNAAYNIPVCGGDDGTLARIGAMGANIINTVEMFASGAQSFARTASTGSIPVGGTGSQVAQSLSNLKNLPDIVNPTFSTYTTNTNMSGSISACTNGRFYLDFLYANVAYGGYKEGSSQSNYARANGYPSYAIGVIKNFRYGYGEFFVIPDGWDIQGATDDEKAEIISYLETGVFVNGGQS